MLIVKCAHCGAGNRNVSDKDVCFQCGNVLGAAPERTGPALTVALGETVCFKQLPFGLTVAQPAREREQGPVNSRFAAFATFATVVAIGLVGLIFLFR